jgi:polysaccharide export outer membrane protein
MRFCYFVLILAVVSCKPSRDLVYFSNLEESDIDTTKTIENLETPTIQPDDVLGITVNSLSVESNMLFNQGVLGTLGSPVADGEQQNNRQVEGYLVDQQGYINFPVIGRLKLGGLTRAAATDTIQNILNRDYVENPTVNIRFLNFKVTVLGEVRNPSSYVITTERINVLEAIALAGDMTAVGKRENVLIIRENNGERKLIRVNLNDKSLLDSPNYYLQQNDIVYIEADSYKAAQADLRRANVQFILSITLTAMTIATLAITLSQ